MAKSVKNINWKSIALVVGLGFAWTKLGLGVAVREFMPPPFTEYPPITEVGYMGQAEWQTLYGGSQLDYEDWLRGQ